MNFLIHDARDMNSTACVSVHYYLKSNEYES